MQVYSLCEKYSQRGYNKAVPISCGLCLKRQPLFLPRITGLVLNLKIMICVCCACIGEQTNETNESKGKLKLQKATKIWQQDKFFSDRAIMIH